MIRYLLLLLLVSTSFLLTGQVTSTDNNIVLSKTNSISIFEVLKTLEKEKKVNFLYEAGLFSKSKMISAPNYNENLSQILEKIFTGIAIQYEFLDAKNIVLKRSSGSILKKMEVIQPEKIAIEESWSGNISDSRTGEPMIGVSVIAVEDKTIGTISDFEGKFELMLPDNITKLEFSYIGYVTQIIDLDGNGPLNVLMKEDYTQLEEIVVTAVGIEANKRLLGYSVNEIKAEDIANSNESNIVNALNGKTAGVLITSSSGAPGASANIRIRGNKSINGSNNPLIIVDGIPIDNSSAGNSNAGVDVSNRAIDINPNDIESVSVLKGPAATSLYGIRAANGALIITTKKGKKGVPVIQIKSSYGLSQVNKLPARQFTYAQGTYSGGEAIYKGPETGEANSYGPAISSLEYDGDQTYKYDERGRLVAQGTGNGIPATIFDPERDFFANGHSFDNNVSVSGGNDLMRYYISGGSLIQQGIVPKSTWSRYSFKGNFDVNLTKKLTLSTNTNVIKSGGDRKNKGNALSGVTIGLYRTPISFDNGAGYKGVAAADYERSYIFADGEQRSYRGSGLYDNPYWSVNRVPFTDDVNRVIQGIGLNYKLAEGIKVSYKVGLDSYSDKRDAAWDINSGSEIDGRIDKRTILSNDINSDLILNINKRIGEVWRLETTFGHNFFSSNYQSNTTRGLELTKQGFYSLTNAANIESDVSISQKKLFGVYGDIKVGWNDIVYLNFTGRNDWSSTLPKQNNSFFYPTVSGGVEFTELFGLTDSKYVSYGKIRASYGQVGNDAPAYRTQNYFIQAIAGGDGLLPSYSFPAFGVNAFERSSILGNADLKAEKTTTFEIGTDLKLFRGLASIDFTYYKAITTDLIVQSQISATSGYSSAFVNAGEILNEGIEVVLSLSPIRKENFKWDIDLNFTKSKNIVTDLPEGIDQLELASFSALSSLALEGQPYGVFVGTAYKRNEAGQLVIGVDGWPLTAAQQLQVGDPNPDWIGGMRNTIKYKNIVLSALLDVRHGGDIYNGTKGVLNNLGVGEESGRDRGVTGYIYEGVTATGEQNTVPVDFANPANGSAGIKWKKNGFLGLAEDNIEDGGWVRLREVSIGYNLPSNWFKKVQLSGATATFSGRNLWLKTKYTGVDPETNLRGDTNDTGWDYFNLPNTRSYNFSINLKF